MINKNHSSSISLRLDKNLTQILKDQNDQNKLNDQLKQFFQYQNSYTNAAVTLDSYPDIQNMVELLNKLNNEVKKNLRDLDLCIADIIDFGTYIFYADDNDNNDDNSCDRLSAYYGAFHKRPEEVKKEDNKDKLYRTLQEDFFRKKIIQIQKFHHIDSKELNKYNKKQLIQYLLTRIDNKQDIVDFLNYKNVRNQIGKQYTKANIAKKRYLLKKSSTSK